MNFKMIPLALLLAIPASAGEVKIDNHIFRVPDGFTVEKVAGPGLVDRPIVADFDEQGRLYVADSSGSNEAPKKQLANPTHRIVRLEDTDNDGKYDKSIVFADKMMFPEGAMWRDGSLYVAAPPSIWKLTDTDGDGKCDRREEWFKGKTLTGCANDLHGPYNGPDGWIYWTKGAFAEQTYTLPNGKPFKTRASHIFRARPDGTGIEPVMTGGMDNPVEVAWSPQGDMFFTTTFLQHPGGGKRDGIIHAFYGGLWGKDHEVLDGHIRTSPDLSPVMTHLGPAAPSGLMRYGSTAFGAPFKDNLLCAQFNMHKVSRHVLEPVGATFKTTDHDFLTVAEMHDFHPTDVLEDADGSVLVLDTGGWYKLCCPTSQIGKPDVLGAIYRVRRIGAPTPADPRGAGIDWAKADLEELYRALGDSRPVVRRKGIEALVAKGEDAANFLFKTFDREVSAEVRRDLAWAMTRLPGHEAALAALALLSDSDWSVRVVAWRAVAEHAADLTENERGYIGRQVPHFAEDDQPRTARAAVEALGRLRLPNEDFLVFRRFCHEDAAIRQGLTRAMIELGDPDRLLWLLDVNAEGFVGPPLMALDQSGHRVPPDTIVRALGSKDTQAREAAEWIAERHPEYGEALVEYLGARFHQGPIHSLSKGPLDRQLTRFARIPRIAELLGDMLDRSEVREHRVILLRAMVQSGVKPAPSAWRSGLIKALRSGDRLLVVPAAVNATRALGIADEPGEPIAKALRDVIADESASAKLRLDALSSLPSGPGRLSDSTFGLLASRLRPEIPVSERLNAADVLARAQLLDEQAATLAEFLKTAGPLDAPRLLAAFDRATDDAIGLRIVAALKNSSALASLRVADLKPRFAKFGDPVRKEAEALYATIAKANVDQLAKLEDLAKAIPDGDIRRGQAMFNGSKAACLSCHAIGYVGGTIGPDLSRIGAIRNDRDLLESIVFPSASFVRSYEPMVVATRAGQVHSGIVKKDAIDEVVLVTGADKEVRIPRAEVDEMSPGTVSVMPSGLDSQMTRAELADLIAFLKSRK